MVASQDTYPAHELRGIGWVKTVRDTARSKADFRVETRLSVIRERHERCAIQNMGYVIEAYANSANPEGLTLFVREQ